MVNALALDAAGNLYAGGSFLAAGGAAIPSLARWNGSSWSALGSGFGPAAQGYAYGAEVFALNLQSNSLSIGLEWLSGTKAQVGSAGVNGIARYSLSGSPLLQINYSTGRAGSFFTVGGWGFPPNQNAAITINGHTVGSGLTTDATGALTFLLDAGSAGSGYYVVRVSVNPSASAAFNIHPGAPLRSQEGSGPALTVPAGIAAVPIYLPAIRK